MILASSVDTFGTDEPAPHRHLLKAGPLSAVLEDGNLRDIRYFGIEVVRAINYLVRDMAWGTFKAEISDLEIVEDSDSFRVSYAAICGNEANSLSYRMGITGKAEGGLVLEAAALALTDFHTNRIGFVVLHPADAAGAHLTIRHTDGQSETTRFPKLISADQPAFDIGGLTHEAAPGLWCAIDMEGDAFEMEDQRNWTDASFKTYVRPLSKPRPYWVKKGSSDVQRVSLNLHGGEHVAKALKAVDATLAIGEPIGRMPAMALFCDETVRSANAPLPRGLMQTLVVRQDLSEGPERLAAARRMAADGTSLAVELVMDAVDPSAESAKALRLISHAGIEPSALLVSPRRDFKTRPSGSLPAGQRPIGELVRALRDAGYDGPIGAGSPSNFTEFNRNPPTADYDFIFFGVSAIGHAADDTSVIETLSVYPVVLESAAALCPGKPIWLGPCTIGVRHNPYGRATSANPNRQRIPGAQDDPRHSALFGAAFAVSILAGTAGQPVEHLTLASPYGSFGLVSETGRSRPLAAIQSVSSAAAGCERLEAKCTGSNVSVVAYRSEGGIRALLANLSDKAVEISIPPIFKDASIVGTDGAMEPLNLEPGRVTIAPYRSVLLTA
ncbi:hypothetical protein [Rhizobium sp. RAF56]|jgi:hypothetical protein|uniref:hypothetical protein n=1 Tax=Rhizobium sp. RAF56 TaxID=3233062 RepID=UPI003F9A45BD